MSCPWDLHSLRHVYVDGSYLARWHSNSFALCFLVAAEELHMDDVQEVGPLYFHKSLNIYRFLVFFLGERKPGEIAPKSIYQVELIALTHPVDRMRPALWLQTKAQASYVLQTPAKKAGSHLGCEALQASIPVAFPGRNTLYTGIVLLAAKLHTTCRILLLQAGDFCTAKRSAAGTRVSQLEAGLTDQPAPVIKMLGSLRVGKSTNLTWQTP